MVETKRQSELAHDLEQRGSSASLVTVGQVSAAEARLIINGALGCELDHCHAKDRRDLRGQGRGGDGDDELHGCKG